MASHQRESGLHHVLDVETPIAACSATSPEPVGVPPVDDALFLRCANVFAAYAKAQPPVAHEADITVDIPGFGRATFKNTPFNRGMMAVMEELFAIGAESDIRVAVTRRLMLMATLETEAGRLAPWVRGAEVDEALIRACALARIETIGNDAAFDFDDVERLARLFAAG